MAWVQIEQSMPNHRKTLDMAQRLGIKPVVARGHLVTLWCWALDNADFDGCISRASHVMISCASDWDGDPSLFFTALHESGYVDVVDERVILHDWPDYAGLLMAKRAAHAQKMREKRAKEKGENVSVTCASRDRVTVPNRTVPNQTNKKIYPPEFEVFWSTYPRPEDKTYAGKGGMRG